MPAFNSSGACENLTVPVQNTQNLVISPALLCRGRQRFIMHVQCTCPRGLLMLSKSGQKIISLPNVVSDSLLGLVLRWKFTFFLVL